jgi:hypothetical protein
MFPPLKTFDTLLVKREGALVRHRSILTLLKFPNKRSEESEKKSERERERE